jgi:hypothetical protein
MNSTNPPPDVSTAPKLIASTTPLFVLSLLMFTARVCIRLRNSKFGADDFCICAAMVRCQPVYVYMSDTCVQACGIGLYVDKIIAISYGLGRHVYYLTPNATSAIACLSLFAAEFYVWAVTFVKVSIACMLLRIQHDELWRLGLFGLIGFEFAIAIACCLMYYLRCRPIRALWEFSFPRSRCINNDYYRNFIYVAAGKQYIQFSMSKSQR